MEEIKDYSIEWEINLMDAEYSGLKELCAYSKEDAMNRAVRQITSDMVVAPGLVKILSIWDGDKNL